MIDKRKTASTDSVEVEVDDEESRDTEVGPAGPNEGEGNRTAARRYDEATRRYIESGGSEKAAEEALAAVEGKRGAKVAEELRKAEEDGKKPGIGDDDDR
jgi:hypothetical protein